MKTVVNEISILKQLNHANINKLISFGTNGEMTFEDGKVEYNLVYMVLDYMPKVLFDVCKGYKGKMSEDLARFFMR
jgi:serine/threonine protein kinase